MSNFFPLKCDDNNNNKISKQQRAVQSDNIAVYTRNGHNG